MEVGEFSLGDEKLKSKEEGNNNDTQLIQLVSKLNGPKARSLLLDLLNDIAKLEVVM